MRFHTINGGDKNMYKSGLIVGIVTLLLALGTTLVFPFCVPCLALLVGLAAGYLAGVFEKPGSLEAARKNGAIAGAIGGAGALLGQIIGAAINGYMVGPENALQILQNFGFPTSTYMTPQLYWASTIGGNCCIGLISVLIMAGMGLLGGLLWWSTAGSKSATPPPAFPLS
jgi:hypothetical protein